MGKGDGSQKMRNKRSQRKKKAREKNNTPEAVRERRRAEKLAAEEREQRERDYRIAKIREGGSIWSLEIDGSLSWTCHHCGEEGNEEEETTCLHCEGRRKRQKKPEVYEYDTLPEALNSNGCCIECGQNYNSTTPAFTTSGVKDVVRCQECGCVMRPKKKGWSMW